MKTFESIVWTILGLSLLAGIGYVIYLPLCFVGLAGCSDRYQWNEKLTLEMEVQTGVKTASSVQTVSKIHTLWGLPEAKGVRTNFSGEAVVMEVRPGKYLFALFSSKLNRSRRFGLFYNNDLDEVYRRELNLSKGSYKHGTVKERYDLTMQLKGRAVAIPQRYYPLLVTFKDINDPTSVELVDPENLAATFGHNIKLKRITIEITDEPVTRGKVKQVLNWFTKYRKNGYRLNGEKCVACPVTSKNLADLMSTSDLKVGD